jgi:hypothetical protein
MPDARRPTFFGYGSDINKNAPEVRSEAFLNLLIIVVFLVAGARNHRDLTLPPILL